MSAGVGALAAGVAGSFGSAFGPGMGAPGTGAASAAGAGTGGTGPGFAAGFFAPGFGAAAFADLEAPLGAGFAAFSSFGAVSDAFLA